MTRRTRDVWKYASSYPSPSALEHVLQNTDKFHQHSKNYSLHTWICRQFHLLGKHLSLLHPLLSFTVFVFSLYLYFAIMYIPWHFHCLVTFKTLDLTFICKQAEDDYWYNRNMFLKNVVFFLKILSSLLLLRSFGNLIHDIQSTDWDMEKTVILACF